MKDLIAERDKKEKMKHSIVKWWNVHYMTPEELAAEEAKETEAATSSQTMGVSAQLYDGVQNVQSPLQSDTPDAAQEILDRLNREAAEDEARKQQEIAQARLVAEANFNETTGAYSGAYGTDGADGAYKEQIDAILAEKDDALRNLIQRTEEE